MRAKRKGPRTFSTEVRLLHGYFVQVDLCRAVMTIFGCPPNHLADQLIVQDTPMLKASSKEQGCDLAAGRPHSVSSTDIPQIHDEFELVPD